MFLYRVLKAYDDPSKGIEADNPNANVSVFEHINNWDWKTQYISTCKTFKAVMDFATKEYPKPADRRKIVAIDVFKLLQLVPGCLFIDLAHPDVLEHHIPSGQEEYYKRARNFVEKFDEVLIQTGGEPDPVTGRWVPGRIPAEFIKKQQQTTMFVYRVLKANENPLNGIAADNPAANFSVYDHVINGTWETQYISTCKTYKAVTDFAGKGNYYQPGIRAIVAIDVIKLNQLVPGSIFIDLTHPLVLAQGIPNNGACQDYQKAINYVTKFDEMLIQPRVLYPPTDMWLPSKIPAECMAVMKNV